MQYATRANGRAGLATAAFFALAVSLPSAAQTDAQEAPSGAKPMGRDSAGSASQFPLAAVYFGQDAKRVGLELAGPLIGAGSDRDWACGTCHGYTGQGAEDIPRLAGQPAGYLTKQLHDYATRRRQNDNMRYIALDLSDGEMNALGHFYASMDASSNARPELEGDLERGRELALEGDWQIGVPACYSCHGSSAWGVGEGFPALAGQHPSYIYAQLSAWKAGRRNNSPVGLMHSVASALSDADMRSVADFMATLPAPPSRQTTRLETPAPARLPASARADGRADSRADSQGGSDEHE